MMWSIVKMLKDIKVPDFERFSFVLFSIYNSPKAILTPKSDPSGSIVLVFDNPNVFEIESLTVSEFK